MAVTVQPKIYDGTVHNESKYTVHNFTVLYFN
jgi:hypothetical protein